MKCLLFSAIALFFASTAVHAQSSYEDEGYLQVETITKTMNFPTYSCDGVAVRGNEIKRVANRSKVLYEIYSNDRITAVCERITR